ncbi:hypothetical protein TrLO_g10017 [Triparma laevis f. longispina]|uniref:Uncharacterized protein n=1 Tax=Triparma laevis f. longispina TaxID=1714387 RepID=A0A9W6ZIA0_9STRA|nr:hypothetical protein TrLO_g10017 [Triparma laevis f. longispina]
MQRRGRSADRSVNILLQDDEITTVEPITDNDQDILIETLTNTSISQNRTFRLLLVLVLLMSPLLSLLTPSGISPISHLFNFGHINLLSCCCYLIYVNYKNYIKNVTSINSILKPSKSSSLHLQLYILISYLILKYFNIHSPHNMSVIIVSLINVITFYADCAAWGDKVGIEKLRGEKYHFSDA